jgi:hypothetical protein
VATTRIDPKTGNLVSGGKALFPLGLSDPPPVDGKTPSGGDAWAEVAGAGINFARHYDPWAAGSFAEQLSSVRHKLDVAREHGMQLWLALAGADNTLANKALLTEIVNAVKTHAGLGVWKGADEPLAGRLAPTGLAAVLKHVHSLDPNHPLAIIEAPRPLSGLRQYAGVCDIHGVDIYPVSVPPGKHAARANKDISVVGDVTRIVQDAKPSQSIWTTLQIAWSGVLPPRNQLVFPTLQQARFMAYDAIIAGARGLFFFGGHIRAAMKPSDRVRGFNWTYWRSVQKPLTQELAGPQHVAALLAADAPFKVTASAPDIALSVRQDAGSVYLIVVRRSPTARTKVTFRGLPAGITHGTVLPHGPSNPPRQIGVNGGSFTDTSHYEPHNARVYRFPR